ncbi:tyrosine-type recombinase/integrase [uncultured Streptococcus sp.]|uniref:site-specific integrase n=1 Tax=uncultured Streptococcus sp. TaxID=83427 RepID=UPI0025E99B2D|nr:tyrosine-type recombinase/integrase [uncultured Streptococcus sp.]
MAIKKLKTGSYQLKLYIPHDMQKKLGVGQYYVKRFKTRKEAKLAESAVLLKISDLRAGRDVALSQKEITFKEFYTEYWLDAYKAGQTTNTNTPPVSSTVFQTENMFRLHILPMFGEYSLKYLMSHKRLVLNKLTNKANEYANFKVIRSYVNSVFDWAEELEMIEGNRLKKSISRIKPVKKVQIEREKDEEERYLTSHELSQWLNAIEKDLHNGDLTYMDYALFYTTFLLSDRKSETYALQWKHIDFANNKIYIVQALDRFGNVKSTKGKKKTSFVVSNLLMTILARWKEEQKSILKKYKIRQTDKQFVFTFEDRKGGVNKRLHIDYLNYRMKSIERRHPELAHATPHMLRHTGASLAKLAGYSLSQISEALTHSDSETTKGYINVIDTIPKTVGEIALENLPKNQ